MHSQKSSSNIFNPAELHVSFIVFFSLPFRLMRPELNAHDRNLMIDGKSINGHWVGKEIDLDCTTFVLTFVCEHFTLLIQISESLIRIHKYTRFQK